MYCDDTWKLRGSPVDYFIVFTSKANPTYGDVDATCPVVNGVWFRAVAEDFLVKKSSEALEPGCYVGCLRNSGRNILHGLRIGGYNSGITAMPHRRLV